jgi:hypothetical protein
VTLDSLVFEIIWLSPLGSDNILSKAVHAAIIGQIVVKTIIQAIGAILLNWVTPLKEKSIFN